MLRQLKRRVRGALRSAGFDLVPTDVTWPIIGAEDARILPVYANAVLERRERMRIVQIGANDGVTQDPLYPILRSRENIEAILIEPLPDLCKALETLHADAPGIEIMQAAVSDTPGELRLYTVVRSEDGEIADSKITSSDRSHIERHIRWRSAAEREIFGADPQVLEIVVPAMKMADVLETAGWSSVDLLCIDAEGHDAAIIRDVVADGLDVQMIYFEASNLPRKEVDALFETLNRAGFALVASGRDVLAVERRLAATFGA